MNQDSIYSLTKEQQDAIYDLMYDYRAEGLQYEICAEDHKHTFMELFTSDETDEYGQEGFDFMLSVMDNDGYFDDFEDFMEKRLNDGSDKQKEIDQVLEKIQYLDIDQLKQIRKSINKKIKELD